MQINACVVGWEVLVGAARKLESSKARHTETAILPFLLSLLENTWLGFRVN